MFVLVLVYEPRGEKGKRIHFLGLACPFALNKLAAFDRERRVVRRLTWLALTAFEITDTTTNYIDTSLSYRTCLVGQSLFKRGGKATELHTTKSGSETAEDGRVQASAVEFKRRVN